MTSGKKSSLAEIQFLIQNPFLPVKTIILDICSCIFPCRSWHRYVVSHLLFTWRGRTGLKLSWTIRSEQKQTRQVQTIRNAFKVISRMTGTKAREERASGTVASLSIQWLLMGRDSLQPLDKSQTAFSSTMYHVLALFPHKCLIIQSLMCLNGRNWQLKG